MPSAASARLAGGKRGTQSMRFRSVIARSWNRDPFVSGACRLAQRVRIMYGSSRLLAGVRDLTRVGGQDLII